jgi:hypothetical protein
MANELRVVDRLSWLPMNESLEAIYGNDVSFSRAGITYSEHVVYPADTPSYKSVSHADPVIVTTFDAGGTPVNPQCVIDNVLYGIVGATAIHSFDGSTWSAKLSDTPVPVSILFATLSGSILAFGADGVYRSTDGGLNWVSAKVGSADFVMQARPESHGVHQSASGTIIAAPYVSAGDLNDDDMIIWRSVDDGATWTAALTIEGGSWPDAGTIFHCHSVGKHERLNRWFALFGDTANRRFYISNDDGANWTPWTDYNGLALQPMVMLDYNHATNLLCGADSPACVFTLDGNTKAFAQKLLTEEQRAQRNYVFSMFRHIDGVIYASLYDVAGSAASTVWASADGDHWVCIHRFISGEFGVAKFAGVVDGCLQCRVVTSAGTNQHVAMSLITPRTCSGLVIQPALTNALDSDNKSQGSVAAGYWVGGGTSTVSLVTDATSPTGKYVRCTRDGGLPQLYVCRHATTAVAVTEGDVVQARILARSGMAGPMRINNVSYCSDNGVVITGSPASAAVLSPDVWTEIIVPPLTIPAGVSWCGLLITAGSHNDVFHATAAQIIKNDCDGQWQIGGTARVADVTSYTVDVGREWTNSFCVWPLVGSARLKAQTAYVIKSWQASATQYIEVVYDTSDSKLHLHVVDGGTNNTVSSAAYWFTRDSMLRIRLRVDAHGISLYATQADVVVDVGTDPIADMLSNNITCRYSDTTGVNQFPGVFALDTIYSDTPSLDMPDIPGITTTGAVMLDEGVVDPAGKPSYLHVCGANYTASYRDMRRLVMAGETLWLRTYMRKSNAMTTLPKVQIIDPSDDPITGGTPLSEVMMTDSINVWELKELKWLNSGPTREIIIRTINSDIGKMYSSVNVARVPVEAVGARALRNRQRVSLTEVGL